MRNGRKNMEQEGGKLFTLSCTVNHDFQELPDFTYIGFSDQSVMNYFMIFPTDFQAYTDDPAIAAEFQQMNTEIDFVKQHAYMLSEATTTQYRLLSQRRYQLRNR
ncbi:MAG: hypothetical protein ACLU9T_02215 [Blautia faecis]